MRSRALALSVLGSATVLAGTVQLGTMATTGTGAAASGSTASTSSPASGSTSSAGTSSAATPSSSSASSSSSSSGKSGTYAGAVEETRYGPVQVEIVVRNGRITDVEALQLTNADPRSVGISNQAAPLLRQEALVAQSAKIDVISGATFTSEGYLTSLQSALDKAGL